MNVVLAEDASCDRELFRTYLERCASHEHLPVELTEYTDGSSLIAALPTQADVYFLDIEIPGNDGFQVARAIRELDPDVPLCFVTNLGFLALEGYDVDAIGFLVKPLLYPSFHSTMNRILHRLGKQQNALVSFKVGKTDTYLDKRQVLYAESRDKKTFIHALDEAGRPCQYQIRESLHSLESRLSDQGFFRVHGSFLVNLHHIESVRAADIQIGGQSVPVSKHRKRDFMQELTRYLGGSFR
jgi:DNA-binding LytR/AlgR family response regulator